MQRCSSSPRLDYPSQPRPTLCRHPLTPNPHRPKRRIDTLPTTHPPTQTRTRYSSGTSTPSFSDGVFSSPNRLNVGQVVDACLDIVTSGRLEQLPGLLHSEELLLLDATSHAPRGRHDWADHLTLPYGPGAPAHDEPPPPPLDHLLDAMQQHSPALHLLDSFAIRTLILHRPRLVQKLSGLSLGPRSFVQRVLVEGATGEECVLTMTFMKVLQTPSAPGSAAAAPRWSLSCIKGEPLHPLLPTTLSPEFGPESVVQSQVDALRRRDLRQAYELLAPCSQQQLGGLANFAARMLHPKSPYRALVGHRHATSVRRCHSGRDTFLELVAVQGAAGRGGGDGGEAQLWCWVLKLQRGGEQPSLCTAAAVGQGDGPGAGPVEDCWAIESVVQVQEQELHG